MTVSVVSMSTIVLIGNGTTGILKGFQNFLVYTNNSDQIEKRNDFHFNHLSKPTEMKTKSAGKENFPFHRNIPKHAPLTASSSAVFTTATCRLRSVNERLATCCYELSLVAMESTWQWVAPRAFFPATQPSPNPPQPP